MNTWPEHLQASASGYSWVWWYSQDLCSNKLNGALKVQPWEGGNYFLQWKAAKWRNHLCSSILKGSGFGKMALFMSKDNFFSHSHGPHWDKPPSFKILQKRKAHLLRMQKCRLNLSSSWICQKGLCQLAFILLGTFHFAQMLIYA